MVDAFLRNNMESVDKSAQNRADLCVSACESLTDEEVRAIPIVKAQSLLYPLIKTIKELKAFKAMQEVLTEIEKRPAHYGSIGRPLREKVCAALTLVKECHKGE